MLLENHNDDEFGVDGEGLDPLAQTTKATSPIKLRHFRKSTQMSRRSSDGRSSPYKVSSKNVSRLQKQESLIEVEEAGVNKPLRLLYG